MTNELRAEVNPAIVFPDGVKPYDDVTLRLSKVSDSSLMWSSNWEYAEAGRLDFVWSRRTTLSAWNTQCVRSADSPLAIHGLLHAAALVRSRRNRQDDRSQQSWFLVKDPLAKKVFGHIARKLGPNRASVGHYSHISMPIKGVPSHDDDLVVIPCRNNDGGWQDDLLHLVTGTRGFVYAVSEELDQQDLNLQALDESCRKVGQRRYRRIWLAYSRLRREVVGAAVAYRGSSEFDFISLANRCDVIVHPMLSQQTTASVTRLLMAAAASVYEGFSSETIPVITDERTGKVLVGCGGRFIRERGLAIILETAYEDWHRHVESLYERETRFRKNRYDGEAVEYRSAGAPRPDLVTVAA